MRLAQLKARNSQPFLLTKCLQSSDSNWSIIQPKYLITESMLASLKYLSSSTVLNPKKPTTPFNNTGYLLSPLYRLH